jgi:hypothetical protein
MTDMEFDYFDPILTKLGCVCEDKILHLPNVSQFPKSYMSLSSAEMPKFVVILENEIHLPCAAAEKTEQVHIIFSQA